MLDVYILKGLLQNLDPRLFVGNDYLVVSLFEGSCVKVCQG